MDDNQKRGPDYIEYQNHDPRIFEEEYRVQIIERFHKQLVRPSPSTIAQAEATLNCRFGPELRNLLLTHGRLALASFETLGLSDTKGMDSGLVAYTELWRLRSRKLEHYVVLSVPNDGFVYCCNAHDRVFRYNAWEDTVEPLYLPIMAFVVEKGLRADEMLRMLIEQGE